MEAEKDYIFINYSRKDLPKIAPIVEEMRANGYQVWYDANIQPGKDWPDYIAAHIKNCAVCVAFHSQTSRDSPHCREEIHYALKHGKTVISVYLEDVTLKEGLDMQLTRFQSVRYANPAELLETLRQSPDFERCGGEVPELSQNLSVKTALKEDGRRIFAGFKFLIRKVYIQLAVIFLSFVILTALVIYGRQTPICYLDSDGVLDIISPPFLNVKMTDYSYYTHNFNPPPWASKVTLVQCAVIRKGVTYIGTSSFEQCQNMKFVFIPEGVTSIGRSAFSLCSSLETISFPDSLEILDTFALSHCSRLKSVSFPSNVTEIGSYAFSDCSALKQVQFSDGIRKIKYNAFEGCTALEKITIPNSIRVIENTAFSGCSNLKTVHIQYDPEKVQVVEDWEFISDPDTLYIHATAFDPDTEIIYDPPSENADVS